MTRLCIESSRGGGPARHFQVGPAGLEPKPGQPWIRCKTIPPVRTLAAAKKIAYRLVRKLDLLPASNVSIRLQTGPEAGRRYVFRVRHGDITCHVGHAYGPSCD